MLHAGRNPGPGMALPRNISTVLNHLFEGLVTGAPEAARIEYPPHAFGNLQFPGEKDQPGIRTPP